MKAAWPSALSSRLAPMNAASSGLTRISYQRLAPFEIADPGGLIVRRAGLLGGIDARRFPLRAGGGLENDQFIRIWPPGGLDPRRAGGGQRRASAA